MEKEDKDGHSALHSAVRNGHLDVTKYLISKGAMVNKGNNEAEVNGGNNDGRTALRSAAFNGHLDVIKFLISQGADVNKGSNNGWTVLHSAAFNGHLDVTEYLISQGAEVTMGSNEGWTALNIAAFNGHLDVTEYLISQGAELEHNDLTDIHLAILHGHTSTIEKLVSEGADLNIQSPDGQQCLHTAIKLCYNSEKIVQETDTLRKISDEYYKGELSPEKALVFYLLENGAKLDVRDTTGNLAIQYAKDEVVKQMILSR
ncbi:serine/threonine-protein phosphatase 6 regulatory ankyrin repeat subunit C-like [Strongylocentrotus purpuratus]|nr:serine/threonine-protein phosphatase 6 regulatory ankyrin repeat subunit C-like [Strongylocentrotus purpuratus]